MTVGTGRFSVPPAGAGDSAREAWLSEPSKARETAKRLEGPIAVARENDLTHTQVQARLRDLGLALEYHVWVASNDRGRSSSGGTLALGCLDRLPSSIEDAAGAESIRLIDVLWIDAASNCATAAFEVERTTSIYSGIVRMLDLASSGDLHATSGLFLVAPDGRQDEVRNQLCRSAFSRVADLQVRFLPYGELERNKGSIARFGTGMKGGQAIARLL